MHNTWERATEKEVNRLGSLCMLIGDLLLLNLHRAGQDEGVVVLSWAGSWCVCRSVLGNWKQRSEIEVIFGLNVIIYCWLDLYFTNVRL